MEKIFIQSYQKWKNGSGRGSYYGVNQPFTNWLSKFLKDNHIKTLIDIGCGDHQLMYHVDMNDTYYAGFDCVTNVVENTQYQHPDKHFFHSDALDIKQNGEVYLIKDVLIHWNNSEIIDYLSKLIQKPFRYIVLVNCYSKVNNDIITGSHHTLSSDTYPLNQFNPVSILKYYTNMEKEICLISNNTSLLPLQLKSIVPRICICFVCHGGNAKLEPKAILLAISLKLLICQKDYIDFVVCVPSGYEPPSKKCLETLIVLGFRIVEIQNPIGKHYAIGNKLAALGVETCAPCTLFLDTDVIITRQINIDTLLSYGYAAKIADGLSYNTWDAVYDLFKLSLPSGKFDKTTMSNELTFPYYNAGMLLIPNGKQFSSEWIRICQIIDSSPNVLNKYPWLDQIGLPIVENLLGVNFRRLGNEWNFPANWKISLSFQVDELPYIVHYHDIENILSNTSLSSYCINILCRFIKKYPTLNIDPLYDFSDKFTTLILEPANILPIFHYKLQKLDDFMYNSGEDLEGNIYHAHGSFQIDARLCPKQANLLALSKIVQEVYEIGFNAGHSCLLWLLGNSLIDITCFDIGSHQYAKRASEHLLEEFPERLKVIWGDSAETFPLYMKNLLIKTQCVRLFHIDGGHGVDSAQQDIDNVLSYAFQGDYLVLDNIQVPHIEAMWKQLIICGYINDISINYLPTTRYIHKIGLILRKKIIL